MSNIFKIPLKTIPIENCGDLFITTSAVGSYAPYSGSKQKKIRLNNIPIIRVLPFLSFALAKRQASIKKLSFETCLNHSNARQEKVRQFPCEKKKMN